MSLRTRLLRAMAPVVLLAVVLMTVLSRRVIENILVEQTAKRARSLVSGFDRIPAVIEGIEEDDERKLLPNLQAALAAGASMAAALDMNGRVVAHTNVAERGKIYNDLSTLEDLRSDVPVPRRIRQRGEPALRLAVPVFKEERPSEEQLLLGVRPSRQRVGTLLVVMSLSDALETARSISLGVFLIIFAIALVALALGAFFMKKALRPVSILAEATRRVGAGQMGESVPVLAEDELGDLARSFNRMSRDLAQVTVSKKFLDGILANIFDALIVADLDGHVRMLNRSAIDLLGDDESGLVGQSLADLLSRRGFPFDRVQEEIRAAGLASGEASLAGAGAAAIPVLYSAVRFEEGIIVSFRDISGRKRAEDVLAAKNLELERSNKELEQFAYVASHDLQEPLRKIRNFSELLAIRYKGKLSVDADRYLGYISDGVTRMQALILDLLAYSRAGRSDRPDEPVDMGEVARRVLEDMAPSIAEARAEVEVGPLPRVRGDPIRLGQLLQNLIGNAVKFRSSRPPVVKVRAKEAPREWLFSVEDNGIGIDPKFAGKLFVIFQRLHSRAEYPGTGIGLAICKKIVETMGGKIWVESQPDKGAKFIFTIPKATVNNGR